MYCVSSLCGFLIPDYDGYKILPHLGTSKAETSPTLTSMKNLAAYMPPTSSSQLKQQYKVVGFQLILTQFPARGSTQVLLCLFPGVLWLWHFLYSVGPHPVSSLHIYTFVVSRAFMAGAASQAGDADSSRAPGLTSGLQGSVNVHRGTLLLVPQWRCISSFVFYIFVTLVPFAVWSW